MSAILAFQANANGHLRSTGPVACPWNKQWYTCYYKRPVIEKIMILLRVKHVLGMNYWEWCSTRGLYPRISEHGCGLGRQEPDLSPFSDGMSLTLPLASWIQDSTGKMIECDMISRASADCRTVLDRDGLVLKCSTKSTHNVTTKRLDVLREIRKVALPSKHTSSPSTAGSSTNLL